MTELGAGGPWVSEPSCPVGWRGAQKEALGSHPSPPLASCSSSVVETLFPHCGTSPTRKTSQVPHQNYEGSRADHCHSRLTAPAHQRPSWDFQHKHVFSGPNRASGGSLKVLPGLQGFHMEQQRTEDNSTGLMAVGSLTCSGCCRHHMSPRVSEPRGQGGQEGHPGAWPGADMLGRAAPSLTLGRGKLISVDGTSGHR